MLIQTLLIFLIIILPLSINVTSAQPPYSISNTESGGMSYFNSLLIESGYNTTRTILSTDPIIKLPESSTLIIAGGSKNYQDSEILAIDGFVLQGGLLVILAGSGPTNLLAKHFGVFLSTSTILETTESGCSGSVVTPDITIGIEELNQLERRLRIFPNPNEGVFNV